MTAGQGLLFLRSPRNILYRRQVRAGQLHGDRKALQRQGLTTFIQLTSAPSRPAEPFTDQLRRAVAACLARFKGSSREHTGSDLRCCLSWCAERGPDPLAAQRPHGELYIRWMQEIRRFKPCTVSRRFSVAAGLLPDLRAGRRPAAFTGRPRTPPRRPGRITHARVHSPAVRGPAHRRPAVREPLATSRWWPCSACPACGSSKPPARTSPTSARNTATGCCGSAARAPR
jgi:hypothetical protein